MKTKFLERTVKTAEKASLWKVVEAIQ